MSIAIAVVGQVLLKIGMDRIGNVHVSGFQSIVQMIFDISRTWQVVVGLVLYVGSSLLWLIALSKVDLSYAYPFVIVGYALVILASWLVLHEQLPPLRVAGISLSLLGTVLIALSHRA